MAFKDMLVARAIEEWTWFGKDTGRADHYIDATGKTTSQQTTGGTPNRRKETVEPYASRIADYWLAIPTADYKRLVKDFAKTLGKLDGTVNLPWSAAFISYCMQLSGAGALFPYAPGHATWIVKSINNRAKGKTKAALVGYRPGELVLGTGDLIGRSRQAGVTYDNAVATGWFTAHTDIVVGIDLPRRKAMVIGGNVGQTVSRSEVEITADGKLKGVDGWMVHIQNNISPPLVAPPPPQNMLVMAG